MLTKVVERWGSFSNELKEGGFAFLHLHYNEITDVSPLKGLTNLEYLFLSDSTKHHTLQSNP